MIEFLEHPADHKVRCTAASLEEAFDLVAKSFGKYLSCSKNDGEYEISLSAHRLTSLLFDFIDELLYHMDTNQQIPVGAKCAIGKVKGGFVLEGKILYQKSDVSYPFKAATYHEMLITTQKKYIVEFVVDV